MTWNTDYSLFAQEELNLVLTFLIATLDFLSDLEIFNEKYDDLEKLEFKVRRFLEPENNEHVDFTSDELKLVFHCSLGITDARSHMDGENYIPNPRYDDLDLKLRNLIYSRTGDEAFSP